MLSDKSKQPKSQRHKRPVGETVELFIVTILSLGLYAAAVVFFFEMAESEPASGAWLLIVFIGAIFGLGWLLNWLNGLWTTDSNDPQDV